MGGRENKRKPHEYSWHPEYGWQLLRRTASYKQAVDLFLKSAERAKDYASLALYQKLSKPDFYSTKSLVKTIIFPERDESLRSSIAEPRIFGVVTDKDIRKQRMLFEELELEHSTSKPRKEFIDFESPHFKLFRLWYGDVIRFPLSPELLHVHEAVLNELWVYRPIMIATKNSFLRNTNQQEWDASSTWELPNYQYKSDDKCSYHIIKINKNFSPERIRDEIADYFYQISQNTEYQRAKLPWSQADFDLRLEVIDDIAEAKESGKRLGATSLAKKYFSKMRQSDLAKKKMMEKIIKYGANTMLLIFERRRPVETKKRFA